MERNVSRHPEYDYVIAGGGSAGCAAAGRLIQKYGARVLLLEAGVPDSNPLIRMPAASFKIVYGKGREITEPSSPPQPSLGGRTVAMPQANVLGGGSSVNAMVYLRGTPSDYDRWADQVGWEWGWDWHGMLAYFREQEGNIRFNDAYHGMDGPYKVADPLHVDEGSHRFLQTMQAMGLPYIDDFNRDVKYGAGFMQLATHRGRRWSAADAFVHNVDRPELLTIDTGASVTRALFDGYRATGVEYVKNGRIERAYARHEILLAAGALRTPKIVMLSGIGPAQSLRGFGIDIRVDLPGVGQNLVDHPMTGIANFSRIRGYLGDDKGLRMIRNGLQYKLFGTGPVTTNGAEVQAFVKMCGADEANVQIYHVSLLWPTVRVAKPATGITLLANLVRPYSRGEVRLRSADPRDDVLVDPRWLSDTRDMDVMVESMRFLRKAMRTRPFADIMGEEAMPGASVESDAQLRDFIRQTIETDYHPCGTCKMGRDDDPMAVLTPDLRVRGVDGLRVIDASMMPEIPAANLNCTVTAVAAKAVDMMMNNKSETVSG